MIPDVMEIEETNDMEFRAAEAGYEPHIGREMNGWTVGIDAFASPILK
jgi:hypothetical protein